MNIRKCKDRKCGVGLSRCCLDCENINICPHKCDGASYDCEYSEYTPTERRRAYREKKRTGLFLIAYIILIAVILGVGALIMGNLYWIAKTQTDVLDRVNLLEIEILDRLEGNRPTEQMAPQNAIGEFTITHYCACKKCCGKTDGITATGTLATEGRTIAVDPSVIPLGSEVIIDGHSYIAEDTGGAIKGYKVDVFVADHQEAIQRGKFVREVRYEHNE
jgi:3D (Asp-Asp-Asp) domain-containing protein